MDYLKAFIVGGIICALVQILLEKTKMMPGRVMVTLVVSGAILGAIGLYEPFAKWAGAGATVPLLGFGNTLWKGVKEGMVRMAPKARQAKGKARLNSYDKLLNEDGEEWLVVFRKAGAELHDARKARSGEIPHRAFFCI